MKTPNNANVFCAGTRRLTFLRSTLAALLFLSAVGHVSGADVSTHYVSWTKPWAERPATSAALGDTELKAAISIVTGEADVNKVADMTPAERLAQAYQIKVAATEVATNGLCRDYFISNTSAKSTPPRQLSAADHQKITALLAGLPDDQGQLPLAGRRVVVQTLENGQWHVRVYDGKKLPTEVKALLDQLANSYAAVL